MEITNSEERYLRAKGVWRISTPVKSKRFKKRRSPKTASYHLDSDTFLNYVDELKTRNTSRKTLFS